MDPKDVLEALIIDPECSILRLKRARQLSGTRHHPIGANRLPKSPQLSDLAEPTTPSFARYYRQSLQSCRASPERLRPKVKAGGALGYRKWNGRLPGGCPGHGVHCVMAGASLRVATRTSIHGPFRFCVLPESGKVMVHEVSKESSRIRCLARRSGPIARSRSHLSLSRLAS